jgi:hypothetical protein
LPEEKKPEQDFTRKSTENDSKSVENFSSRYLLNEQSGDEDGVFGHEVKILKH